MMDHIVWLLSPYLLWIQVHHLYLTLLLFTVDARNVESDHGFCEGDKNDENDDEDDDEDDENDGN